MPYIHVPPIHLGPLSIHIFGIIAAVAVVLGAKATRHCAADLGLDIGLVDRLMPWLLLGVIVGAHVMSVLLYFPGRVVREPLVLLRLWDGLSSFGGILGGLVAAYLFFRRLGLRMKHYKQALLFGAVVSLLVGRFGCSIAHDHPGRITKAPVAVQGWPTAETAQRPLGFYSDGARRHDLGLYEFLYLIPLTGALYALRRFRPFEDFHLVFVLLLYTPVRFSLDYLRIGERRYYGLTPGQYLSLLFFMIAIYMLFHRLKHLRIRSGPDTAT
jgi:phosphatidylglycerol---prolipoprotein diacylglyceryl transferase